MRSIGQASSPTIRINGRESTSPRATSRRYFSRCNASRKVPENPAHDRKAWYGGSSVWQFAQGEEVGSCSGFPQITHTGGWITLA